eukprot:3308492-Lingulodinium_polyedra.AAC.1
MACGSACLVHTEAAVWEWTISHVRFQWGLQTDYVLLALCCEPTHCCTSLVVVFSMRVDLAHT